MRLVAYGGRGIRGDLGETTVISAPALLVFVGEYSGFPGGGMRMGGSGRFRGVSLARRPGRSALRRKPDSSAREFRNQELSGGLFRIMLPPRFP